MRISDLLPGLVESLSEGTGPDEGEPTKARSIGRPEPQPQAAMEAGALAVLAHWEQVAPVAWRESAIPVKFAAGELVVAAADGATASVLRFRVGTLIDAYSEYFGQPVVQTVRVVLER